MNEVYALHRYSYESQCDDSDSIELYESRDDALAVLNENAEDNKNQKNFDRGEDWFEYSCGDWFYRYWIETLPIKHKDVTLSVAVKKPLSTNAPLSKNQLIGYLQKADIPGDAECTLQFDEGRFYLYFYWSEDAGTFGHTAVNFDVESKELIEDAWNYMEKD